MNLARAVPLLLLVIAGCETPIRRDESANTKAPAPPSSEGRLPALDHAARPPASDTPRAPTRAALGDSPLILNSGAALTLPADAVALAGPSGLPAEVRFGHMFRLGDAARIMVNELTRPEPGCAAALDAEWQKLERAKSDADPARLEYRRVSSIESLMIAGRRTLYSDAVQRAVKNDAPSPPSTLATLTFCTATDYVVIMYALKGAGLPASAKTMLLGVAESYRAPRP
ncbi:MAG: hypothetical protein EXR75_06965 [Myxococcales bacterium]|nr:hypothetical protein [Myxococcales bacterium]